MRHKTKNRLIKKKKGRKTKKMKMKGGGFMDYFTTTSVGIPGVGSVGRCQDKPICNWKTQQNDIQKCYMTPVGPVYKTVQPDSGAANGAANGAATPTKSWYQFW